MPSLNPGRMFRRLRRKFLPRPARHRAGRFLWQFGGPGLMIAAAVILIIGAWQLAQVHRAADAANPPAGASRTGRSLIIIGLGLGVLGLSIQRSYRHSLGQIESQLGKKLKKKAG